MYPAIDIPIGLELPESVERGRLLKYQEMIAANWIRYAGKEREDVF
jgi:hypothetical protein